MPEIFMLISPIPNEIVLLFLYIAAGYICNLTVPQKKQPRIEETAKDNTLRQSQQNPELRQLQNRKKEIESTIEQFNNPSTFAKYSKMQRELLKINKAINTLHQNQKEKGSDDKASLNGESVKQSPPMVKNRRLFPFWAKVVVNAVLASASKLLYTSVLLRNDEFPMNLIVDEDGRASCIYVVLKDLRNFVQQSES